MVQCLVVINSFAFRYLPIKLKIHSIDISLKKLCETFYKNKKTDHMILFISLE